MDMIAVDAPTDAEIDRYYAGSSTEHGVTRLPKHKKTTITEDPWADDIRHYYAKLCRDLKEKKLVPNYKSFASAIKEFDAFLISRLPNVVKDFMACGEDDELHIALMPYHHFGSNIRSINVDLWEKIWDESSGRLYKMMEKIIPKRPGLKTCITPYLIPSTSKDTPTLFVAIVAWFYKSKPVKTPLLNCCEVYVNPECEDPC
jgi:hypothetical protein